MAFEFKRTVSYSFSRVVAEPSINGNTFSQVIGDKEILDGVIEWVVAERIQQVIEDLVPQLANEDFVLDGEIIPERAIGEGHNLFNIPFRATRFVPSHIASRSSILVNGA